MNDVRLPDFVLRHLHPWVGERARGDRAALVALAGLVVLLVGLALRSWYVCDDAYISFRYTKNVVEGLGLRWNPEDPPVEGFSNPVWLALSILVRALHFDELRVMPTLSIGLAVGVMLTVAGWVRHEHPAARWPAVAAAGCLACSSAFANWSTSGLETMQAAAALLAAVLAWTYEAPWWLRGGLGVVLVASRPEGVAWAAACMGIGALRQPRSWVRYGLAATVIVLGTEVLLLTRWAVFDAWIPNTASAKSGHDLDYFLRGVRYVVHMAVVLVLPVPAVALALARGVRWIGAHRLALRAGDPGTPSLQPFAAADVAAVVVLGHVVFAAAVGGDYMPFGRFLLGALPFAAFLLGDAVARSTGARGSRASVEMVLVAVLSALPQFDVSLTTTRMREVLDFRNFAGFRPTEREMWRAEATRPLGWKKEGQYLRRFLAEDERYMVVAIGAAGYYAHRYVYDVCYLVQPMPKGTVLAAGKGPPGHDSCVMKKLPAELAARKIATGAGFTEVPAQGQLGDVWSERLPDRAVRTYYRARLVDPSEKPERFFTLNRYDPDDLPEEAP